MSDGLTAFLKKYNKYMKKPNKIFIKKKIYSYKKKQNFLYFIHFIFYLIIEKVTIK